MLHNPQAAQQALLLMYAEDMYAALARDQHSCLNPPIDVRVSSEWNVTGYLTAVDALLDTQSLGGGTRSYYGFLASSHADPSRYVAVIRGTASVGEWLEDLEFLPMDAPQNMAGMVESGFYSIYDSLRYTPVGGTALQPVVDGLAAAVGAGRMTVLGHSLGSALGTYLTLDLAVSGKLSQPPAACLFASPHPGDYKFASFFDQKVKSYQVYNYARDLVPKVPPMFGYSPLLQATEFKPAEAGAIIKNSLIGNHHAICYAAMLDYGAADWKNVLPIDKTPAAYIQGPNT